VVEFRRPLDLQGWSGNDGLFMEKAIRTEEGIPHEFDAWQSRSDGNLGGNGMSTRWWWMRLRPNPWRSERRPSLSHSCPINLGSTDCNAGDVGKADDAQGNAKDWQLIGRLFSESSQDDLAGLRRKTAQKIILVLFCSGKCLKNEPAIDQICPWNMERIDASRILQMQLLTESYREQLQRWPKSGRHILAQFDADTIFVYQAYHPSIGEFAAKNGYFGNGFSYSRMSWIKPNFLWMMYRSGWGTKPNQEVTLALRIRRSFFEQILESAVPSSWDREAFLTEDDWKQAVSKSNVRLQWDPDHHPNGAKLERRAIQLGLRGDILKAFGSSELLEVIDLSEFVYGQRIQIELHGIESLTTPRERVYIPEDINLATKLRLDSVSNAS
jgi:hypothetical protein